MYMTKWNNPVYRSFFDRYYNEDSDNQERKCYRKPATNISEDDDKFQLDIAVPGLEKKDIEINVEKDLLTIKYENGKEDQVNYTHREFGQHSFCRTFSLGEKIDMEKIEANYNNGVLNVTLPKKEEAKPVKKQIEIA